MKLAPSRQTIYRASSDQCKWSFDARTFLKQMIDKKRAIKYCKNDISLIENYDKAIADKSQVWHCHHRRETIFSRKDLIEIGEYYNRPAAELIFLTPLEHHRLHNLGKHPSEETRKKLSEVHKGKHHSAEARKKMSEAKKGENHPFFCKHHSEESRKKISESMIGKHSSAETRKKMSEARKGKPKSEETRKKMSEARKGSYFFNNGVICVRAKTCPEGFVKGRLPGLNVGRKLSEETKRKIGEANKKGANI